MDPTTATVVATILAAVVGALIGAAVTHYRAKADWEEMARTVQRDAAGALVAAAQDFAWGLLIFRTNLEDLEDQPPDWDMEAEGRERFEETHRRFQVELNRARMAVVEPEARKVVSDLHQTFRAMYADAPIDGVTMKPYTDWMHQMETMLYDHGKRLLNVGVRNLKPGGPDRRPRLPWRRRKSGHREGE
ncbi:hypothetical protein G6030_01670 [Dietzia sp. E1]|uniref:hypothetical protein n=1 Tax=Dietzia sp. E1 TaxID=328361 RepID=UPI0015F87DD9|nr:hypothetical protein [Dietzia sp. E1]MBB1020020.1 hypothetical protein [Dietzia sp. E1]